MENVEGDYIVNGGENQQQHKVFPYEDEIMKKLSRRFDILKYYTWKRFINN